MKDKAEFEAQQIADRAPKGNLVDPPKQIHDTIEGAMGDEFLNDTPVGSVKVNQRKLKAMGWKVELIFEGNDGLFYGVFHDGKGNYFGKHISKLRHNLLRIVNRQAS
jgi:hypothetical protein